MTPSSDSEFTTPASTAGYQPPTPSKFTRLLWRAAGADERLLAECTYNEHVKFAGLGGIVTATGLLAGLAGGFAFWTVFRPKGDDPALLGSVSAALLSVLFGALWGAIIFNLDRYIVASTGKGDGTEAITRQELVNALPRMVLGAIIGITISAPLEIRIFESEINAKLRQVRQERMVEYRHATEATFEKTFADLIDQRAAIENELEQQRARADDAQAKANAEMDGSGGSGVRSQGPIYQKKQAIANEEKARFEELRTRHASRFAELDSTLKARRQERDAELRENEDAIARLDGLQIRMKLGEEVAGPWVTWMIRLLFLAIELTPIFFKLMIIKGPYDYLEENAKELIKARRGITTRFDYVQTARTPALVERTVFLEASKERRRAAQLLVPDAVRANGERDGGGSGVTDEWAIADQSDEVTSPPEHESLESVLIPKDESLVRAVD